MEKYEESLDEIEDWVFHHNRWKKVSVQLNCEGAQPVHAKNSLSKNNILLDDYDTN